MQGTNGNGGKQQWQGVFLDFYGTVASGDVQAVEAVCQEVIDDYQLAVEAPQLAVKWGHAFFAAIEAVGCSTFRCLKEIETETLVDILVPLTGRVAVDKYICSFGKYLGRPTIYEEVREVLESLSVPVCLVSNADDHDLMPALEHHNLKIDFIVSSESAKSYKPESKIFETALKLTGWSPERVVHVGDSLHSDVGGARRMGIKAAWVNRTHRIHDIGTAEPDYTWTDLRPLVALTNGSHR